MYYVILLLTFVFIVDMAMLIAGLFKPVLVVWWEDIQNRRRVFKIYGRIALALLLVILLLDIYFNKQNSFLPFDF